MENVLLTLPKPFYRAGLIAVRPGTHERHLPSRHRSGVVAASVAMNWHSVHTSDKCPATPQRHRRSRIFLQLVSVYFRVSTTSLSKTKRVAVTYLAYEHLYRPVKKRKYWTHPLVSARLLKGAFSTLFEDLKEAYFLPSISFLDLVVVIAKRGIPYTLVLLD